MHCRVCQGQTSVTAGTVFEDNRRKPDTHVFPGDVLHHQPKAYGVEC